MYISSKVRNVKPVYIGEEYYPVIFTHFGVGDRVIDLDGAIEIEKQKIKVAIENGANAICDVSMHKEIKYIHEKVIPEFSVPFGVVTTYEAYIKAQENNLIMNPHEFINIFKEEILRGFDIITIHATVFKDDINFMNKTSRVIPSTSRAGMLMLELMNKNDFENPFYTYFDEILEICSEYNITLSLGPMYRPASVYDCNLRDKLLIKELQRMGELVERANRKKVLVTIEGIGHAPINQIPPIIKKSKELTHKAPYRVMTVSTDIALGYDHISSAIASAVAVYNGADSITCVTRSEHIGIPNLEEVREGVIAAKIATYAGYSARKNDFSRDYEMSKARYEKGCMGQAGLALFPEDVLNLLKKRGEENSKSCTMCGEYCPLDSLERNLNRE